MVSLVYRTSDPAWGAGKGSPLSAAEVDANFHALRRAIEQAGGPPGRGIAGIVQDGWALVVTYSDATTARFVLPAPTFQPRGAWRAGEAYAPGDVVCRLGAAFLCVAHHVAAPGWWADQRRGCWTTLAGTQTDSPTVHPVAAGVSAVWEVPPGVAFSVGQRLRVLSQADRARWMEGTVEAYALAEGVWGITLAVDQAAGSGSLDAPLLVPVGEASLGGGSGGGGVWRAVLAVSSPYILTPAARDTLLRVPAGGHVTLPGTGFVSGDAVWIETARNGGVILEASEGTIESPYSSFHLFNERAWIVHEGGGAWRVAGRLTLPGVRARQVAWTYSLALGGDLTLIDADLGSLILVDPGARVVLPGSDSSALDGDMLWIATTGGLTGQATLVADGGFDGDLAVTEVSVEGQIVHLVCRGGGAWVIASRRTLHLVGEPIRAWRETDVVAAGAVRPVEATEIGRRFILGAGAHLLLPSCEAVPDGSVLWVDVPETARVGVEDITRQGVQVIADRQASQWRVGQRHSLAPAVLPALPEGVGLEALAQRVEVLRVLLCDQGWLSA